MHVYSYQWLSLSTVSKQPIHKMLHKRVHIIYYSSHETSVALIPLSQVNIKQWVTNFSGRLYGDTRLIVPSMFPRNVYVVGEHRWNPSKFRLRLYDWYQDPKERVYLHFWTSKTPSHHTCTISSCLCFCCIKNIITSFLLSPILPYATKHLFTAKRFVHVN